MTSRYHIKEIKHFIRIYRGVRGEGSIALGERGENRRKSRIVSIRANNVVTVQRTTVSEALLVIRFSNIF